MSYYVVRRMVPGYEDYERMVNGSNAHSGWPDLWEPERYAEGALYEEFKALCEQAAMMHRIGKANSITSHEESSVVKALVSIAKENQWEIRNKNDITFYGCQPIYAIPSDPEDDEMPTRWRDVVRWLDHRQTEDEKKESKSKMHHAQVRRTDFSLDYAALSELLGDLMPSCFCLTPQKLKDNRRKLSQESAVCRALVMLAEEDGWKKLDPRGYEGQLQSRVYRIA